MKKMNFAFLMLAMANTAFATDQITCKFQDSKAETDLTSFNTKSLEDPAFKNLAFFGYNAQDQRALAMIRRTLDGRILASIVTGSQTDKTGHKVISKFPTKEIELTVGRAERGSLGDYPETGITLICKP